MLALHPAQLGVDVHQIHARRVIQVQRGLRQISQRDLQPVAVHPRSGIRREICADPRAPPRTTDASAGSTTTFRAKIPPPACAFFGWVATCCAMFIASAVLPMDGRAARMNSSPPCKPAGHFIELREPRAQPAHPLARIEKRIDAAWKLFDDARRRRQLVPRAPFAQLQQRFFGAGQDLVRLFLADQAAIDHFLRAENQLAQRRLVFDDADVAIEIDDLRQPLIERDSGTRIHPRIQAGLASSALRRWSRGRCSSRVVQVLHPREDAAMLLQAEVLWFDRAGHLKVDVSFSRIEPEHESLGIQICGKAFGECKIRGSGCHRRDRSTLTALRARANVFLPVCLAVVSLL